MEYIVELFKFLLGIGIFAGLSILILKKLRKKQMAQTSMNGVISVTDAVQFGMNDRVYLLKVDKEYVLYGVGSSGTSMIKLEQENISIPKEQFDELFSQGNPGAVLKNVTKSIGEKFKS